MALFFLATAISVGADLAAEKFQMGGAAYRAGEFIPAAKFFREAASAQLAAGTFQNLGNAEWQRGRVGPAILTWEQALWLSPADAAARNNLRLARTVGQIEAPELTWYEEVSTWLSADAWAWLTALSLWLVAGMLVLPGILRRRRTGWQQALAAVGLTFFLLSLPAHVGLVTRSHIGFVLQPETPLRLTPTLDAQEITRLAAGEPARYEGRRGDYYYVRLNHAAGWVARADLGLVCPK